MKVIVYLGTGGVGKTSVAAATALQLAHEGKKAIVLTIDPALRLRTALHLDKNVPEQRVTLNAPGELWAGLLDVRATLDDAVRMYAKPDKVQPILTHPIYQTIADSLVGMQELMAVERIDQLKRRGFEYIVVDTAPSRHALEFLDKPMFFAELVGSRWVKLLGRTYKFVAASGLGSLGRKTVDLYARVEAILGANLVRQVLEFYSLFVSIAEGYAARAEKTVAMLKDPSVTEFRVVTTPQKAWRDAAYFAEALTARDFPLSTMFINRAWLLGTGPAEGPAAAVAEWYNAVRDSHLKSIQSVRAAYAGRIRNIAALGELERDVDGIEALERIRAEMV